MRTIYPRLAAMMVERPLTAREELANTLSHGVGLALVIFVAWPALIVSAVRRHDGWLLAGGMIFGLSLAALFALGALRGVIGGAVFAAAWTFAALGIALKLKDGFRHPLFSTALYLLMGWMVVFILHPLIAGIGWAGFGWLAAGGLCYTLGVAFYLWEQLHYSHAWWHGFVLAGSACHCVAVVGYAGGLGS